jgi:hypothetical protein
VVRVDEEVDGGEEGARRPAGGFGEIDREADRRVVEDAAIDVEALAELGRAGRLGRLAGEGADALALVGTFADAVAHHLVLGAARRAVAELARAEGEGKGAGGERGLRGLERADSREAVRLAEQQLRVRGILVGGQWRGDDSRLSALVDLEAPGNHEALPARPQSGHQALLGPGAGDGQAHRDRASWLEADAVRSEDFVPQSLEGALQRRGGEQPVVPGERGRVVGQQVLEAHGHPEVVEEIRVRMIVARLRPLLAPHGGRHEGVDRPGGSARHGRQVRGPIRGPQVADDRPGQACLVAAQADASADGEGKPVADRAGRRRGNQREREEDHERSQGLPRACRRGRLRS